MVESQSAASHSPWEHTDQESTPVSTPATRIFRLAVQARKPTPTFQVREVSRSCVHHSDAQYGITEVSQLNQLALSSGPLARARYIDNYWTGAIGNWSVLL